MKTNKTASFNEDKVVKCELIHLIISEKFRRKESFYKPAGFQLACFSSVPQKLLRNAAFGNLFGVLALHQSGRLSAVSRPVYMKRLTNKAEPLFVSLQEPQVVLGCVKLLQSLGPHRQHLKDLPTRTTMDILTEVTFQTQSQ